MNEAELREVVANILHNVATGKLAVKSIYKNIINECCGVVINSRRLINYREKGVALHGY